MTKTNVIILLQLFTKYKLTRENVESHSIWMRDYWMNPWKNDIFYYNFIIKMSGPVSYAHLLWCLFSLFCSRSVCEVFRCSGSGFLSAWRLHYVQRVSISLPVVLIYLWISQWRAELTLCLCAAKLWLRPQIQFVFGCQRWRRVVLSASWDTRSVLFY